MNILKKFVVGFVALIVLMAGISCSLADTILPLADSVFDATSGTFLLGQSEALLCDI